MALLLTPLFGSADVWRRAFAAEMPDLDVRYWPEIGDPDDIEIAAIGTLPPGELRKLPNLRLIISLLAGSDALFRDPDLPDVPIARAGDPAGDAMMNETALLHVLRHHRQLPALQQAQQRSEWLRLPIRRASDCQVGVMGLGAIGLSIAKMLAAFGFKVAGWVRRPRRGGDIEVFSGPDQLIEFLARTEILLNLLPLTVETRNIICADMLRRLPAGAAIINLGRGEHLVEDDLIVALDSGHIAAATLDVFRTEPLPQHSPLWRHPKITITPHASRRIDPNDLVPRICRGIRNFRAGIPLALAVDRSHGY
jgi:glyoxylate/hydroxypyruvate reductase A